jgi:hypothetical protein
MTTKELDRVYHPGQILWLFGRGLSIECGLNWDVPGHWSHLPCNEKVYRIREQLRAEMDAPGVDIGPIREFLQFLSVRTRGGWWHRFLTTNWDFLLQLEIEKLVPDVVPDWLHHHSEVLHLNGTVEVLDDDSNRSALVLPDEDSAHKPSLELNMALSEMAWVRTFVVVGMSFECGPDRALFNLLNKVQDLLPVGESDWIIVNPCQTTLDTTHDLIKCKLPQANVTLVCDTFARWREARFPRLMGKGVFSE